MDEKFANIWTGWFAVSLAGLGMWLVRNQGGWNAFRKAPTQKHTLSGIDVLIVMIVYFAVMAVRAGFLGGAEADNAGNLDGAYLGLLAEQLIMVGVILYLAQQRFTGGLRGFGLSSEQPAKTAGWSLGYFVITTGLTLLTLQVTIEICAAVGVEEVQKHETLEKLSAQPPLFTMILLLVTALVGAPVMEELLFRGILQTYFIRFIGWATRPTMPDGVREENHPVEASGAGARWLGILLASLLFAVSHANWQHIPALAVLSVCLGYSYERRKNLLAPILVHSLFNLISVSGTLMNG